MEAVAYVRSGCRPMSANKLTVACWMFLSGQFGSTPTRVESEFASSGGTPVSVSWCASKPQLHWTVPAPNTRAPLA